MKESKIVKSLITTVAIFAISAPAIASTGTDIGLKGQAVKVSYADTSCARRSARADSGLCSRRNNCGR